VTFLDFFLVMFELLHANAAKKKTV
jgi:hypothetical protein